VFYKHGKAVMELLDDNASLDGATYGRSIDMQQVFFNYTLESMGEIGFGVELGCLSSKASPFSEAFDAAQSLTMARVFDPLWKLKRALCIGKNERELYDALKTVDTFSIDVIADRRSELENPSASNNGGRRDLLSLFIEAGQKLKEKNQLEAASNVVGDKFLRDMIINMLIAGRDTTACTLSWTTYLLSQHPEIEEQLLREIHNATDGRGDALTDRDLSAEKMPYLHGVVSEALRLYPPVPTDLKYAVMDDVLPDGTKVPAGVDVQYNPYIQNRDPDLWEKPMECNPARWIDDEGRTISVCPYTFPVFQAGPRLCLGQRMAYFEAKLLLAMLLPHFRFVLEPGAVIVPDQASITLSVKGSLPMKILKRNMQK
jgi:cytochrome P450